MAAADIRSVMSKLSNWDRWGGDDEAGTLNLITPDKRAAAARLVSRGCAVSLAHPITPETSDVHGPPQRLMLSMSAGPPADPPTTTPPFAVAAEYLGIAYHGLTVTHLDAPAHFAFDGSIYNGRPASSVEPDLGATASSVAVAEAGITTRGVLLDVPAALGVPFLEPGHRVTPAELAACEGRQGVTAAEGDAVLLRTGIAVRTRGYDIATLRTEAKAGWSHESLAWLHERGVAVIGCDGPTDAVPSGTQDQGVPLPVHAVGLVAMGLWLLDNCALEQVAAACREFSAWEFLLCVAPLRVAGGTGSPVNPLAIF